MYVKKSWTVVINVKKLATMENANASKKYLLSADVESKKSKLFVGEKPYV